MPAPFDPVTIPGSEARSLPSAIVDEHFELSIALPPGYDHSDDCYPVVYASPAFPDFFFLWPAIRSLNLSEELPPLILVGIGYPVEKPTEIVLRRLRDHMPAPDEEMDRAMVEWVGSDPVGVAEADAFLHFIREELQPFVDDEYRTRPGDNTYAGFSSGGLFGLHVLFSEPETFSRYILGSPPIFRSDRAILAREADYAAGHDDLPARLFLAAGALEERDDPFEAIRPEYHFVSNVQALSARLAQRDYPGLELTTEIFEGETHLSVTPALYSRGLRELFQNGAD